MAYRCPNCDEDWPQIALYRECPLCAGVVTKPVNSTALDPTDAAHMIADELERRAHHDAFEKYYEDREIARFHQEVDGDLLSLAGKQPSEVTDGL